MGDDYYKTLGVPPDADERLIRSAYRILAKKFHPDTGTGSSAERFRAVQDAYDVLIDPVKRERYDHERHAHRSDRSSPGHHEPVAAPRFEWMFDKIRQEVPSHHIDLRHIHRYREAEPIGGQFCARSGKTDRLDDFDRLFRKLIEDFFGRW